MYAWCTSSRAITHTTRCSFRTTLCLSCPAMEPPEPRSRAYETILHRGPRGTWAAKGTGKPELVKRSAAESHQYGERPRRKRGRKRQFSDADSEMDEDAPEMLAEGAVDRGGGLGTAYQPHGVAEEGVAAAPLVGIGVDVDGVEVEDGIRDAKGDAGGADYEPDDAGLPDGFFDDAEDDNIAYEDADGPQQGRGGFGHPVRLDTVLDYAALAEAPDVDFSSATKGVATVCERARFLFAVAQRRLDARVVEAPRGWQASCASPQKLHMRILGTVLAAYGTYAQRSYGMQGGVVMFMAVVMRVTRDFPDVEVPCVGHDPLRRRVADTLYLLGLGAKDEVSVDTSPLLCGFVAGHRAPQVHVALSRPSLAATAAFVRGSTRHDILHVTRGPYLAFRTTSGSLDTPVPASEGFEGLVTVEAVEGGLEGKAGAGVATARARVRGTPVVLRASLRDLPGDLVLAGHHLRTLVRCHDEDPLWTWFCSMADRDGRTADVAAVVEAARLVDGNGVKVVERVSCSFEDSRECSSAWGTLRNVITTIEARTRARAFLLPLCLSQNGVSVSMSESGRSVEPVMVAPMAGRSGRFMSARNVSVVGFVPKLEAKGGDLARDINRHRLNHAIIRRAISSVGECLDDVLHVARVHEAIDVGEGGEVALVVPIPYVALLAVDQVEVHAMESLAASTADARTFCSRCATLCPVRTLGAVVVAAREKVAAPAELDRAWERVRFRSDPSTIVKDVDCLERALLDAGNPRQVINAARGVHRWPIVSVDAFAACTRVMRTGFGLDVTANVSVSRALPHHRSTALYHGDTLHLLRLAGSHMVDMLAGELGRAHLVQTYKEAWRLCARGAPRNVGPSGSFDGAALIFPKEIAEAERYGYVYRTCLVLAAMSLHATLPRGVREVVVGLVAPLVRITQELYPSHCRALGSILSEGSSNAAESAAEAFSDAYMVIAPRNKPIVTTKEIMTHHRLVHACEAGSIVGSYQLASMSSLEHLHYNSRAASYATDRQTITTDPRISFFLGLAGHDIDASLRMASPVDTSSDFSASGWPTVARAAKLDPEGMLADDAAESALALVVRLLEATDDAAVIADDGIAVRPDAIARLRHGEGVLAAYQASWIPVDSYMVDSISFLAGDEVPPTVFSAWGWKQEAGSIGGATFTFGGCVVTHAEGIDGHAHRVTYVVGAVAKGDEPVPLVPLARSCIAPKAHHSSLDFACPVWAVGAVHASLVRVPPAASPPHLEPVMVFLDGVHPATAVPSPRSLRT